MAGLTGALPQEWQGLALLVLVLGVKHGMDPDHLAMIDALARFNAVNRPRLARWSGCLFSLGHGFVVTLVAAMVAAITTDWSTPAWLELVGAWISIVFLLALGAANLVAVFGTPRDQVVRAQGIKGRWLGGLARSSHPVVIATIGAAFALSFDTFSQAALFSLTATHVAGWIFSVALGLVFTAGMMAADGINGVWVARMLSRADRRALVASRLMSLTIAILGISIAALGALRIFAPEAAFAIAGAGMPVGLVVVALVLSSFGLAMRISAPDEQVEAGSKAHAEGR